MLRIKPFAALRPESDAAERIASVPYDVIDSSEARALARGNEDSFLHVIRPEIDLPEDVSLYDDSVYDKARENLESFQVRGLLQREPGEHLYLYRQQATLLGRQVSQTGLVCCCHIDDYAQNRIKKHEKTRADKEADRTRHVLDLRANAEPVFFLHEDSEGISAATSRAQSNATELYDFTAPDGVRHTVWRIDSALSPELIDAFAALECAYVADGHHRTASAANAGAALREQNPGHTGDEEYNWFLTVLFPESELSILPYNRVVKDLNAKSASDVLEEIRRVASVTPTDDPSPASPHTVCMHLPGTGERADWFRVEFAGSTIDERDPINSLDYVILADRVLGPILGIGDVRTDKRIDFVGGIRGTDELEKRVAEGRAAVAFSMFPVSIAQLIAVSDAGEIMPPKSTWFEPKLRSGLLVHTLD